MKRIWTSVITLFLLSTMAIGCSGNGSDKTADNGQKAGTAEKVGDTAVKPTTGKTQNEPIELTYVVTQEVQSMTPVVEAFEKENPNIKIKLEQYPFRQLFEKIEVLMGSKSKNVDILDVDGPLVQNYSVKGYLEPIEKYLSKGTKDKWVSALVNAYSFKSELMTAPLNTSSQVLFYNKEIFKERGVEPLSADINKRLTWEEVVELSKKLTYDKNGDNQTDVFGFSVEQISRPYQTLSFAYSLGAKPISDDGLTAKGFTNSPEMIQAGQFYFDLYNTWKISPKIPVEQSKEYFTSGKIAMFLSSPRNLKPYQDAGVSFGIAPHPYFAGKKMATPTGSWTLGISKYSEKKEAAGKFIEFATAGKGATVWFEKTDNVPALISEIEKIEKDAKYNDFPLNALRISAYEAKNTAAARPPTPGYLEWESIVNKAYEDIKNGTNPKTALDNAANDIDRQLVKYKAAVK